MDVGTVNVNVLSLTIQHVIINAKMREMNLNQELPTSMAATCVYAALYWTVIHHVEDLVEAKKDLSIHKDVQHTAMNVFQKMVPKTVNIGGQKEFRELPLSFNLHRKNIYC